jgi:Glycosyl hydrolase catalytic core
MLFQTLAVLAMLASVMAHPRASSRANFRAGRHGHKSKVSGSGKLVDPTGGKYSMGNNTYGYGPTGTGFLTSTISIPTKAAVESPVDTAISPESDRASCGTDGESTTTIYSTDLVTITVTLEDTITVKTPASAVSSVAPDIVSSASSSIVRSASPQTNRTVTVISITETGSSEIASAVPTSSIGGMETPSPVSPSAMTAEQSSADSYESPAEAMTSPVTSTIDDLPSEPTSAVSSATSASPAEPTEAAEESSEASYPSSTMNAPGGFFEVPESSSTAPAAASTSSFSTAVEYSVPSNGKRGLAYNSAALTNAFAGAMSWAYNWADHPDGSLPSGMEFVPMLWGQKKFGDWDAAAKKAIAAGAKYLQSFNEPDLAGQANMDTATAAAAHIKYMNPYAGQAKIGSPAITNGGPSGGTDGLGLGWLQNFFDKCNGNCKVDFVSFHWYDSAENVAYFKNYVQDVIAMAKKNGVNKVWMTEFAADGSDAQVAKFLSEVLPFLDSNDAVERYAYFMCSEGRLVSGSGMSVVGKAYAG